MRARPTTVLTALWLVANLLGSAPGIAQNRVFTVRDSIEMARFSRLENVPKVQFSPDGRYFATVTSRGIIRSNLTESTIWIFRTAEVRAFVAGARATAAAPRPLARIALVGQMAYYPDSYEPAIFAVTWLADSSGLLFLEQGARGELRLHRTDLASGVTRVLTPPGLDVLRFASAADAITYELAPRATAAPIGERINADATDVTNLPLPVSSEPLYSILYPNGPIFYDNSLMSLLFPKFYPDKRTGTVYTLRGGVVTKSMGSWSSVTAQQAGAPKTSGLTIAVREGLNTPPALWVTDNATRVSKKLWDPNPWLAGINLGRASILRWRDPTGYTWVAGLVTPPDYAPGRRYPLVIQTHGFTANELLTDGAYTTAMAARPLAGAGIIVLQMPDAFRYGSDSPQGVSNMARGYLSGIARLDAAGMINPKRVGIIGFSVTGQYVWKALFKSPPSFAAASFTEANDASYMEFLTWAHGYYEKLYGTPPFGKGLQTWVKQAPDFTSASLHIPILLSANQSFQVLNDWETFVTLRLQKKPVDLMYIPYGQHILQRPLDRMASQQGNVDWFRFWLQGYVDPDPQKAAQYRRWEGLRALQRANQAHQ